MVCGATSNAGKTTLVTGLCRLLARRGVGVAPFKAQNMSLNSAVTASGHEIGRAQAAQAFAAGLEPEVAMNPILLKPTTDRKSQVVVAGRRVGDMTAAEYHQHSHRYLPQVLELLAELRARFDVVLCEGAGSPAEINLLDHDIVNLRVAAEAGFVAILVGDIEPGGVFAGLYGTVALLPDTFRPLVQGYVINKLRGDPALLLDGCAQLEALSGVPTLGVVPWIEGISLDAEDSLALDLPRPADDVDALDVAVVRFPRISNFTDLDPLVHEPGVGVRLVTDPYSLGHPDLVILPGTKSTVSDLAWLRARGLDRALRDTTATVLGICGGYQMLGQVIHDDVELNVGRVDGLGLLPVSTSFQASKVTERCHGTSFGQDVTGYRIHHGRVRAVGGQPFVEVGGTPDGITVDNVYGTTVHGLLEADAFRHAFLQTVAAGAGKTFVGSATSFGAIRQARVDRLADLLETHLDIDAVSRLITKGDPDTPRVAPT